MNEHAARVDALVDQVLMTIDEPYESVRWMLDQHSYASMGDPQQEGSGAWHLMHLCEVFRIHAQAFLGADEIGSWPSMPGGLGSCVEMLREDAGRFAAWCRANPELVGDVHHGEDLTCAMMIGVMHRHIVWHAAAVHYWCLWKGRSEAV
jgi:hypothetical protein